jgi:type II secretory pathway component PulK
MIRTLTRLRDFSFEKSTRRCRRGISLLEVIACVILLSVIIVPLSGMMRASVRSVESARGLTNQDRSIDAYRFLRRSVSRSDSFLVTGSRNEQLQTTSNSGVTSQWFVRNRALVHVSDRVETILIDDVSSIEFNMIPREVDPAKFDLAFVIERSSGPRIMRQDHWIEGPL